MNGIVFNGTNMTNINIGEGFVSAGTRNIDEGEKLTVGAPAMPF